MKLLYQGNGDLLQAQQHGPAANRAYGCFFDRHTRTWKVPLVGTIRAYTGPSSST
jgi:hypothetical protein